jgi:hypothetical protein
MRLPTQYSSDVAEMWRRDHPVVVFPNAKTPPHLELLAAEARGPGEDFAWLLCGTGENLAARSVARLLAVLSTNASVPLLFPVLHPQQVSPPMAAINRAGQLVESRGTQLPSEVSRVLDELADRFLREEDQAIQGILETLRGRRPPSALPLPPEHWLSDPEDLAMLLSLPDSHVEPEMLGDFGGPDTPSHFVTHDYLQKPYLAQASDAELKELLRDAVINMYEFTRSGAVIEMGQTATMRWLARFQEAQVEASRRYEKLPLSWLQDLAPLWENGFKDPRRPAALRTARVLAREAGDVIFKFGSAKYLRMALEHGELRIQPASAYSDPSLNLARRDDELSFTHEVDVDRSRFSVLDHDGANEAPITPTKVSRTWTAPTDYWVWCATLRASARMFVDFDADACLVIRDVDAFAQRLTRSLRSVDEKVRLCRGAVNYVNRFSPEARKATAGTDKDIGYEYQREYRLLWLPGSASESLDTLNLQVEPLEDIAEIVLLR